MDESWFSRLARAALNSWSDAGEPLRLVEQSVAKDDPDPKANLLLWVVFAGV